MNSQQNNKTIPKNTPFHTTNNKQITICQAFRVKQGTDYLGADKATDRGCPDIRLEWGIRLLIGSNFCTGNYLKTTTFEKQAGFSNWILS